jgi:hypothetical protein
MASISVAVLIGDDLHAFVCGTETFLKHPTHNVIIENLGNVVYQGKNKISLGTYLDLLDWLRDLNNRELVEEAKAELIVSPLD